MTPKKPERGVLPARADEWTFCRTLLWSLLHNPQKVDEAERELSELIMFGNATFWDITEAVWRYAPSAIDPHAPLRKALLSGSVVASGAPPKGKRELIPPECWHDLSLGDFSDAPAYGRIAAMPIAEFSGDKDSYHFRNVLFLGETVRRAFSGREISNRTPQRSMKQFVTDPYWVQQAIDELQAENVDIRPTRIAEKLAQILARHGRLGANPNSIAATRRKHHESGGVI